MLRENIACKDFIPFKKQYKNLFYNIYEKICIHFHEHKNNFHCNQFIVRTQKSYEGFLLENYSKNLKTKKIICYQLYDYTNRKEYYIPKELVFDNYIDKNFYQEGFNDDKIFALDKNDIQKYLSQYYKEQFEKYKNLVLK